MLSITEHAPSVLRIGNTVIAIEFAKNGNVRMHIDADDELIIHRGELVMRILEDNGWSVDPVIYAERPLGLCCYRPEAPTACYTIKEALAQCPSTRKPSGPQR